MGSFNAIFGRKDRGTVLVKYSGGQLEVTSRNVKTGEACLFSPTSKEHNW